MGLIFDVAEGGLAPVVGMLFPCLQNPRAWRREAAGGDAFAELSSFEGADTFTIIHTLYSTSLVQLIQSPHIRLCH